VPSPASGPNPVVVVVSVGVGVGDVDGEPLSVGDSVGDVELVVADAEGDVLFDGECVGFGDFRALVVGLGERVALGYSGAVPRLVPGE
jgi:hypothetical protein